MIYSSKEWQIAGVSKSEGGITLRRYAKTTVIEIYALSIHVCSYPLLHAGRRVATHVQSFAYIGILVPPC